MVISRSTQQQTIEGSSQVCFVWLGFSTEVKVCVEARFYYAGQPGTFPHLRIHFSFGYFSFIHHYSVLNCAI